MKNIIKQFLFILILFGCLTSIGQAGSTSYSVSDVINHFNMVDTAVTEFYVENCQNLPWLQKSLCDEIYNEVTAKLDEIRPHIGNNELIFRDYWRGEREIVDDTYLTMTDILLRILGDTSIGVIDGGLSIDDVFFPYVARLYIDASASGEGDGYVKNKICVVPNPFGDCISVDINKDDFDIYFYGDAQFDIIAGFVPNAKILETEEDYILVLKPVFRLIARDSDVDIGYDIDGLDWITHITKILNIGDNALDLGSDLAMFNFDGAIQDLVDIGENGAISMLSFIVFHDDLADDALFEMASEFTNYLADDYLDQETNRILYEQEKAVNDQIKEILNLDEEGFVKYRFPKPKIHGRSFAEIIPALTLLI